VLDFRVDVGASESLIADCRYGIRGDQVLVSDYRYTTMFLLFLLAWWNGMASGIMKICGSYNK